MSKEEALDILKLVRNDKDCPGKQSHSKPGASKTLSALDMLRDEQSQQTIITFSEQLDAILGGGVPLTKITEFCGAPGIGKTQMWYVQILAINIYLTETSMFRLASIKDTQH